MPDSDIALERILAEQRECVPLAATDAGARLGLADWVLEESLLLLERREAAK